MKPSQRIFINTAATYARYVLTTGLALFSIRWVLNALGQSDFGLFSVIGSLIVFITFLNSVLAWSASRYFAYAIGQGDPSEINRWFNATLGIHLCLATILTLIGWSIGDYMIAHILTIPADRVPACLWVFRISLISAFVSMVSIPFVAMFMAKQHFAELATWGLLYSLLAFTLAWLLIRMPGDRLLFYTIGIVVIIVFVQSMQIYRAIAVFRECRIVCQQLFDKCRFKKLLSFAIWNLIGNLGATLKKQGAAILLNLLFGPKVNAAYGIANQVSSQTDQLAYSMIVTLSPEITTSEGRGNRARMLSLSERTNKIGTIFVMIFAIPLLVEMKYVLNLWLGEQPLYAALFCQLILCTMLIDRLSTGYRLAVEAHGRIVGFQATMCAIQVLTLPLAWLFLKLGFTPTSVGVAFIITTAISSYGRLLWVRYLFGVSIRYWLASVFFPCGLVAVGATLAALAPGWLLPPSFVRLAFTATASIAASSITAWFLAFDGKEREFIGQNTRRLLRKISGEWRRSERVAVAKKTL